LARKEKEMSVSFPSVLIIVAGRDSGSIVASVRSLGVEWNATIKSDVLRWQGYSCNLDLSGGIVDEYDPETLEEVSREIDDPFVIYLSSESIGAARALLPKVLDGFDGLLETNHGDIVEFARFLQLIAQYPEWDWRRMEVSVLLGQEG
jgi:hypothetical protein